MQGKPSARSARKNRYAVFIKVKERSYDLKHSSSSIILRDCSRSCLYPAPEASYLVAPVGRSLAHSASADSAICSRVRLVSAERSAFFGGSIESPPLIRNQGCFFS